MQIPQLATALGALSLALSVSAASSPLKRAAKTFCTPSQPCWPTTAEWNAFNATIGGRLIKVVPWGTYCFASGPTGYDGAKCSAVANSYIDSVVRANTLGTAEQDNWTSCYSDVGDDDDCILNAALPFLQSGSLPYTRTCKLGRLSPYAVETLSPQDAVKAFAFAKERNIRTVIKNTGHDYVGRSSAPDGLTLWTKHMTSLKYEENFMGQPAIRVGAGVMGIDAYTFASANGKALTLGASKSVGVGGGYMMGGGHGPLGPTHGLAVDSALQFTIVTVDGVVRLANAQSNSDLFWALRGGGGGVYGLVTEVVYKAHSDTSMVSFRFNSTLQGHVVAGDKDADLAAFVSEMAAYAADWRVKGWAGYVYLYEDKVVTNFVAPGSSASMADRDFGAFIAWIKQQNTFGLPSWRVDQETRVLPTVESYAKTVLNGGNAPVGFAQRLASRLIPTAAFATQASRKQLGLDIIKAMRANVPTVSIQNVLTLIKPVPFQIYMTGPKPASLGGPSGEATGVNPAWRDSLFEVVAATGWIRGLPRWLTDYLADNSDKAMNNLRQYPGTYYNEASALEKNWQTAFFGSNYPRLLSIKNKYDPEGRLSVFKGVGYEGQESQSAFRCYQHA